MNKRITYIDIAKGIGIILVIAGHLFRYDSYINTVIFSFHMPLFFFLAGMVEHHQNLKFSEYLKKAFRNCLLPWIMFYIIGFLCTLLIPKWYSNFNVNEVAEHIYIMNMDNIHVGQIWFLVSLFNVKILFWFFCRYIIKNKNVPFTLFSLIAITIIQKLAVAIAEIYLPYHKLPLRIDCSLIGMVFYIIGFIYKEYKDEVSEQVHIFTFLICLLLVAVSPYNKHINVANIYLGEDDYFFYIFAFSGIFMVLIISKYIERKSYHWLRDTLQYIGKMSLYVFAVHSFGLSLWAYIVSFYRGDTISCMGNMNYIDCFIGIIVVLLFSMLISIFIQRIQQMFCSGVGKVNKLLKRD